MFTEAELRDFLSRDEGQFLEFKSTWDRTGSAPKHVNAFAHRDYERQGRDVEVWFYDDRMEASSPGDLFPPVTLARLRARRPAHATRNPLIVRVLADAGVMRDEGEGVARICRRMNR